MRQFMAAAGFLVLFNSVCMAQPMQIEPTLTVQGQGRVLVPPDHANLTVEVITKGRSAEAATAAHRDRALRATNKLRDMKDGGLEIEQSVFRLNEVRPSPGPGAAQGRGEPEYQAITSFELKMTRLSNVDANVTALASTGLFEVRGIRFGIEERNPGMNEARKNAVEDARDRAMTFAQAAGVQLGQIVRISDTDARTPRDFMAVAPMARSVQIIPPETLTLSASVTITWRIATKP
jgi:uncharacterized protein YggE